MQNCPDEEIILDFVGGRLSAAAMDLVERHADQCSTCMDLLAQATELTSGSRTQGLSTPPVHTQRVNPFASTALCDTVVAAPSDQHSPVDADHVFPGYRVVGILGAGGMGVVYRAMHEMSGDDVAIKTVWARKPEVIAAMRREIHALSRLDHPNVVHIREQGIENGWPWYAMDLVPGQTLAGHLEGLPTTNRRSGHAPALVGMVCRMAWALSRVHSRGIVHRDLKPHNVIIRTNGTPVLVDFGLATRDARVGHEVLDSVTSVVGTFPYMAPEQLRVDLIDARADLYALGCILYEVLVGCPPFGMTSMAKIIQGHLYEVPVPPSEFVDALDPALEKLVLRLLAKRPRDRMAYAEDVAAALRPFSDPETRAMSPERTAAYVYRPEFSGRTEIFDTLESMLSRAMDGHGAQVFIAGESGVGKTRLIAELARRARDRNCLVIMGECMAISARPTRETERSTALHPFRPLLQAVVNACSRSKETADRLVGSRGKILAAFEPALLDLPGQQEQLDPPPLPTQAARYRLLCALQETLTALATQGPVLLILDDLQWADDLSLDFLDTLSSTFLAQHRILIVGTYRSEEATTRLLSMSDERRTQRISLGRFGAIAMENMVSDMLGAEHVPVQLLTPLLDASEGNAFFAAEYLRVAVDEGLIRRNESGSWYLDSEKYRSNPPPGSLRALIEYRLARLSPASRKVIDAAAVMGRQSESGLLVQIAELPEIESMDALRDLVTSAFLEEVPGNVFRFVHEKLREMTYDAIPEDHCRTLHHRAALALEGLELGTGRVADAAVTYSLLAHHWEVADAPSKAMTYLEKAGECALEMAAYAEAAGFFQRAVELEQGQRARADVPTDRLRYARWQRRLGEAYYGLGDLSRSATHSSQALADFGSPLPHSTKGWIMQLVTQLGRQAQRGLAFQTALVRIPERNDNAYEAALAAACIAHHYYFAHDSLALATVLLLAVNLAEGATTRVGLARPYAQLGYLSGILRFQAVSKAYFAQARSDAQSTKDQNALALALYPEAILHLGEGAWDQAQEIGMQALSLLEEIKNPQEIEVVQTILAHVEYGSGRLAESVTRCEALLASARSRCNVQHEAWGLYASGRGLVRLGKFDAALARIEEAKVLLAKRPEVPSEILCAGLAAWAYLGRKDWKNAEYAADQGLQHMDRPLGVFSVGDGYMGVVDAYLALAERELDRGARIPIELWKKVQRARTTLDRFALLFPIAQPAALIAAGRVHMLEGHRFRAERCFRRAHAHAAALQMPYEQAMADLMLARHGSFQRAREHHFRAAQSTFERLGCAAQIETSRGK